jgi:DNA-binding response OmpR family regulator
MPANVLLISNQLDSAWLQNVDEVLGSIACLQVVAAQGAFAHVKSQAYDLILIDATAIGGDVAGLVVQLRQELHRTPILVMTNSPTWQRTRQIFLAGATDYIRKPSDAKKLLEICKNILAKYFAGSPVD